MKVCILASTLAHGGASIVALDVAKGIAKRGHQVLFICTGKSFSKYRQNGYTVIVLKLNKRTPIFHYFNPLILLKILKLLDEFQPDLIHVHNINLQTLSLGTLLFSFKYPMVWTLHDVWALCMTGWPDPPDCAGMRFKCRNCPSWSAPIVMTNKFIKEVVFKYSNFNIVSPSKWLARLIENSYLCRKPIYIIQNGIEISSIQPEQSARLKFGISKEKKVILYCGGKLIAGKLPAERKGWEYLVKALSILSRIRDDIHLLYIGDHLRLPSKLPVSVTFSTGVDRRMMGAYYKASNIFVLPTLADNCPLTILEAMAFKIPIVATDVGGIPEILKNFQTGLICAPRDAVALAASMHYLLSNPKIGNTFADNGYKRLLAELSFEHMVDGYENVYRQTIEDFPKKNTNRRNVR